MHQPLAAIKSPCSSVVSSNQVSEDVKIQPCPAVAPVEAATAENEATNSGNNCGECIDNLLSTISDQSLLELCKDAGLIPSSSKSFSDPNSYPFDNDLRAPTDTAPTKLPMSCQSFRVACSDSLESAIDANTSLLDDLCKLIDGDIDMEATSAPSFPISTQEKSVTAQNQSVASQCFSQTDRKEQSQRNFASIALERSNQTISCKDSPLRPTVLSFPSLGIDSFWNLEPRSSFSESKKKNVGKRVKSFMRTIKKNSKKSRKSQVDKKSRLAQVTANIEYLNKSYDVIRKERKRKRKLYRCCQPQQKASIRYVSSPTRHITTLDSGRVLTGKKKNRCLKKKKNTDIHSPESFCDVISTDRACKAVEPVRPPTASYSPESFCDVISTDRACKAVEPVRPPTASFFKKNKDVDLDLSPTTSHLIEKNVDFDLRLSLKEIKSPIVVISPLKCSFDCPPLQDTSSNCRKPTVVPSCVAFNSRCNRHIQERQQTRPRRRKRLSTKLQPYALLYQLVPVPCGHLTYLCNGKKTLNVTSLHPVDTTENFLSPFG